MPALVQAGGQWTRDVTPARSVYGNQYAIHRYRPRVDSLFARIERWVNLSDPEDTFWRSITKDNVTTWYGKTAGSRIADPATGSRLQLADLRELTTTRETSLPTSTSRKIRRAST